MRIITTCSIALCLVAAASASTLTKPQIQKALSDLEMCIRVMCMPVNDSSMSLSWAKDLKAKLAVNPNPTDNWVLTRLDPVIALLAAKKLPEALAKTQDLAWGFSRPDVLSALNRLESCVRLMCLPGGEASMGIGYAKDIVVQMKQYPGPHGTFVSQRLNAAVLLLEQKKIAEGLAHIQATIKTLPNP